MFRCCCFENVSDWRETPWCTWCEPKNPTNNLATCWEIPVCIVCFKLSSLTKLLRQLKPWKYLRDNLFPSGQGLVVPLKTFGALYWPGALWALPCPELQCLLVWTVFPVFQCFWKGPCGYCSQYFQGRTFPWSDVGLLGILFPALVFFPNL